MRRGVRRSDGTVGPEARPRVEKGSGAAGAAPFAHRASRRRSASVGLGEKAFDLVAERGGRPLSHASALHGFPERALESEVRIAALTYLEVSLHLRGRDALQLPVEEIVDETQRFRARDGALPTASATLVVVELIEGCHIRNSLYSSS